MRVAVVNQHLRDVVGGSELQCHLIAAGLAGRGHDVRYVIPSERFDDVDLTGLPYEAVAVADDPAALARACIAFDADVVYWRRNRRGLKRFAGHLAGPRIPIVFATAHIDDVHRWPIRDWPAVSGPRDVLAELRARASERASWSAFGAVAAVALQREDFRGRLPVDDQRLVRNLIDPDWPRAGPVSTVWAWPRPFVLWLGRIQRRKRPEELPELADALARHGVDVVVAGDAPDPGSARHVSGPGTPSNLHHVGLLPLEEVRAALSSARVLVLTAREEGMSNAMLQAWALGVPVVSLSYDPDRIISQERLGIVADGDRRVFHDATAAIARGDDGLGVADAATIAGVARRMFGAEENLGVLEQLLVDVARRAAAPARREGRRG